MRKKDAHAQQNEELLRITAQYVAEVRSGQQPRLSEYLARYPRYADAIAEFVAYYDAVESDLPGPLDQPQPLSTISQQAMARLQARSTQADTPEGSTTHMVTSLLMRKGKQQLSLSRLAQVTGLSEDILWQLEQRRIDVRTIPFELYRRLGQALHESPLAIQRFFVQERSSSAAFQRRVAEEQMPYHSSDSEETMRAVSFRDALAESVYLSPEQKASWYSILGEEGL